MERIMGATDAATTSPVTIPFGRPVVGEPEAEMINEVLRSGILTQGPVVKRFEAEFAAFTGAPHAVATSSCMGALHLAYLALGLKPGDEVIVPAQTHVATAMAVEACGGRCVFVDVDAATGNIDLARVREAITPRTVGITLVHFLGVPVDMREVRQIADAHALFVVEDCALALGARVDGKHVGPWGDAGAFSFYPAKHITTGEGGMLITHRADIAARASAQRAFAVNRTGPDIRPGGVDYDVTALGFNYRMNEMSGALGVCQMQRLPEMLATRNANFDLLTDALSTIEGIKPLGVTNDRLQNAWYCLSFYVTDGMLGRRDALAKFLRARGIGTSVYYPRPVPSMRYFRERYALRGDAFPCAARISEASIALPVAPHLKPNDIRYMAQAVSDGVAALHQ